MKDWKVNYSDEAQWQYNSLSPEIKNEIDWALKNQYWPEKPIVKRMYDRVVSSFWPLRTKSHRILCFVNDREQTVEVLQITQDPKPF